MSAIAMGDAGVITRILGPSRGSFLTYGSLEEERGTAPGQLTTRDLREVFRIDHIDLDTRVFGIMGHPVRHSLSPRIDNSAYAASGINDGYIPFAVQGALQCSGRM